MSLVNSGTKLITDRLNNVGTPLDNTNSYLGVGDSNTGEDAGYVNLQGTNKSFIGMMDSFPEHTLGSNSMTFRSLFGPGDGNFAWYEWAIFNGDRSTSSAYMLNRKVENNGVKVSGQTWEFTVTISIIT